METHALPSLCARNPLSSLAPEQLLVVSSENWGELPLQEGGGAAGDGELYRGQLLPQPITQGGENRER